jgi:hypothetical protein
VIVVRVGAEYPIVTLRGRNRHLQIRVGTIHVADEKAKQNVTVTRFGLWKEELIPTAGVADDWIRLTA